MLDITQTESSDENTVKIRRGKVDSVLLYEITDHELEILERGTPISVFLNFGIFLVSIGSSFLIALLTTQISSDRTFYVFTLLVIVCLVAGIVLLSLWYRNKQSIPALISKIKNRIPSEEAKEPTEHEESK